MAKIDIDSFVASMIKVGERHGFALPLWRESLKEMGLEFKDGEIVSAGSGQREELTEFEIIFHAIASSYVSDFDYTSAFVKKKATEMLDAARKQIVAEIDVDTIVTKKGLQSQFWNPDFRNYYKRGVEDVLNKIKEG